MILQLLRFGFTCFKKPRKDNMPISLSREIVVNLGSTNTAEVKMMPSSEKSHLDRFILLLTLSFSRFTTHLWASSAILAKKPMVVRFMTYHSHTSYGVNQLHNDTNKCVSSPLSRPLHLWRCLPWGRPRWHDGLLAHLRWRKSQQDDLWGCVSAAAEVGLPAVLPETRVKEPDLWHRKWVQKTKHGSKSSRLLS